MSNKISLGDYLRGLRGTESLRSVADRSNGSLSHSYISDLEKGVSRRGNEIKPSPETLKTLAKVYNADYNYLMKLAGYEVSAESREQKELTVEQALKSVMSYEGKPVTDNDRKVLASIIEAYLKENKSNE
ncbi:helix-turn-helix domain-containing protein [Enterococcus nangangensis]|uniref:helix-turn-helix domain-containing protein n=1 Tax=Enterococcus nangangensis TaxID=2559926 RepID=UPI0010FA513D|nr:helix-turn-helix transcriptional regulator [Enterococcus nangangensis]